VSGVHRLASRSHATPSSFDGSLQTPVPGSHVPATWHGSSAAQITGTPLVQIPP